MLHFMAFACKTGSIDRCLGLHVWASALGSLAGRLARLSLQLRIICPKGFQLPLFHLFPFSVMVASVNLLYHKLILTFGNRRRRGGGRSEK